MRVLVVGFGSIGERHSRILREDGHDVAVVSRRPHASSLPRFDSILSGVEGHRPSYVVVASQTSKHFDHLLELIEAGYTGSILVEKPLFEAPRDIPAHGFHGLFVGYNLRFHHGLKRLRALLKHEKVLSAEVYAGQYLPDWRPGRDYRDVYSADRAAGGGVLRDLSHELDYLNWIFGGWTQVAALGGKLSSLEVSAEDTVAAVLSFRDCPAATLQLNYLDKPGRRSIVVNTDRQTIELDFASGWLRSTGGATPGLEPIDVGKDETYRSQHHAVVENRHDDLCTVEEAQEVLRLIAAIEESMAHQVWVAR